MGARSRGPIRGDGLLERTPWCRPRSRGRRSVQRILRRAEGTDRVFNPADLPPISVVVFWIGVVAFAGALAVGVYLTVRGGWPILAFALLGGAAAIFYEAPPIRWSYRGLGEAVIALSYGPWMVLGSLYLHTNGVSFGAFLASLLPGCLIMALAVANAIPDFHQDRLVGKRNLVVRLGRRARGPPLSRAGGGRACGGSRGRRRARVRACVPPGAPRRSAARGQRTYRDGHLRTAATFRGRDSPPRRVLRRGRRALRRRYPRRWRAMSAKTNRIDALTAPLFVSWQLTRDCDLCCLHCCTESAPGKRLPDELDADEAMRVVDEIVRSNVPYVMLCGGEPLVVPHFLAVAEALGRARRSAQDRDQRAAARRCDGRASCPAADPLDPDQPRRRYRGDIPAAAAGRLARPGARGLPRGTFGWAAAGSHVRAHDRQHRRAAGGASRVRPRSARSASTPAS